MPRGVKRGNPPPTPRKDRPAAKKRKVSRPTKIKRAKASVARNILTEQFDKRVDYVHVKKRFNKAALNFKKKVVNALAVSQPIVTKLFTVATTATTGVTVGDQTWQIFHLKPWAGQAAAPGAGTLYNEAAQADLSAISTQLDPVYSLNYWIKSAWMEVMVENTSASDGMLEVYELDYVKRAGNPINQYASFNAALTAAIAETTTLGGTAYSLTARGVTPFDITALLRNYGIRVIKKMTSDLQANGRFAYPVMDYRKHYIQSGAIAKDLGSKFAIQGMTKSLLVICKPYQNDGAVGMRCSADKHYRIQPTDALQDNTIGGED